MSDTAAYLKDRERVVTWVIGCFSTVALMVGAWFFSGLAERMDKLNDTITDLRVQVTSLAKDNERLDRLENRVTRLETR